MDLDFSVNFVYFFLEPRQMDALGEHLSLSFTSLAAYTSNLDQFFLVDMDGSLHVVLEKALVDDSSVFVLCVSIWIQKRRS